MENPFEIIIQRLDAIERMIYELKSEKHISNSSLGFGDELMNVKQVAEYLTLTVNTIYGLVHKMEIPNAKRGKRLYFKKSEIDDWISKARRKTYSEIEEEATRYLLRGNKAKF